MLANRLKKILHKCIADSQSAFVPDRSILDNARRDLEGVRVCRITPRISHLLFADDCFLFFQVEEHQANTMKHILNQYEEASSQAISLPKSEIFYSINVQEPLKQSITNILGVRAVLGTSKYLGLPSMAGRRKKSNFQLH